MSSQPTTSEKRYRRLKWGVLASAFGFIVVTAISLYYRIPGVLAWSPQPTIKTSYDGSILTLPEGHTDITRNVHWNQRIDAIPRVASATLPTLLHPTANQRLAAPRASQPYPFDHIRVSKTSPQPYDTAWIELPPPFMEEESTFFHNENLHAWAMAMRPNGVLVVDIDGREHTCSQFQHQIQALHTHFPIIQLWQTGTMRWQLVCAKTPRQVDPTTIDALPQRLPQLHQTLMTHGIMTPWALFAACVTTDATPLSSLTLLPDHHLPLAIKPYYQTSIDELFSAPVPHLNQLREERMHFMEHRFITESPSSDPYLHALVEELLIGDQMHNPRLALQTIQPLIKHLQPTLRILRYYLDAARYSNNKSALDDALIRLEQLPLDHPERDTINHLLFTTYLQLGDKIHAYHFAQRCQSATPTDANIELETLFLQAEINPSREHLSRLHTALAERPSELRQLHLKRYTDLLMQNGYAQEALNILSSLTQTQQFPTSPF